MPWYVITCRLAFEDEDGCYIIPADSDTAAIDEAKRLVRAESEDDENEFILNYVVECDSQPRLIYSITG